MTAETQKNLWRIAWIVGIVILVWKGWPWLKEKLNGGSSSSGGSSGAAGVSSPYPYYENPYGSGQGGGSGGGLSFGGGSGFGNGGGGGAQVTNPLQALWNWISGSEAAQGPNAVKNLSTQSDFNGLAALDSQGLPLAPLQNLNNLPSWSPNDPNAPWNSPTGYSGSSAATSILEYGGGGSAPTSSAYLYNNDGSSVWNDGQEYGGGGGGDDSGY